MGKVFAALVLIALLIFVAPCVTLIAWNMFAVGMFGAPAMTYWTAFWVTNAVQLMFKSSVSFKHD